jgi:hypothetical protein
MDFEKSKEFIEKHIEVFPDMVKEFYALILKHISQLEKNEPIEDFDVEAVKNTVRGMVVDFTDGPLNFNRLQFFEGMAFLVYNWNDNVLKDNDVYTHCISIKKFVECFAVLIKLTSSSKKALDTFNMYKSWAPAVNDVALKYLDELFKENEKCINTGEACSG